MKFSPDLLSTAKCESDVLPGNIYPAKGGRGSPGTYFWLVIACSDNGAHLMGFDDQGNPCSTASYLKRAMRERPVIGRVDLNKIVLEMAK